MLADMRPSSSMRMRAATGPTKTLGDRRALVVDDNEDLAWCLRSHLELRGFEVRVVGDGLAAIEAARVFTPEIMLVDIALPVMNGWRVAREVRRLNLARPPRLFAMSALVETAHREHSLLVGFEAHLGKPLDLARLFELLG